MGGWTGSNDEESIAALERAVALGCTFFDTALAYGQGKSEQLLGRVLAHHRDKTLIVATKIPPEPEVAGAAPSTRSTTSSRAITSADRPRRACTISACRRSTCSSFTCGPTRGPTTTRWQRAVDDLKREKLIRGFGISINRWQPDERAPRARDRARRQRAGRLQRVRSEPGGRAVPGVPRARRGGHRARAVRRRQPHRHADARHDWPEGDWRNLYFTPR